MNENLRDTLAQLLRACEAANIPGSFLLDDLIGNVAHSTPEEVQEIREWVRDQEGSKVGRV